jgi:hypothetical protein
MILTFTADNFTLDTGFYYSLPILLETNDTLMSVEVQLTGNGEVIIQQSISGNTWYDIINATIICAPSGMESYIECQPKLQYRLKSATEFVNATILI